MRTYSITGDQAVASPDATVLALAGHANVEAQILRVRFGSVATPADIVLRWLLQRFTAAGTGTSVTPNPFNPAAGIAALCTAEKNHSVEPTYTSGDVVFDIGVNLRNTYETNYPPGPEAPTLENDAAKGYGLFPQHASHTGDVAATIDFAE